MKKVLSAAAITLLSLLALVQVLAIAFPAEARDIIRGERSIAASSRPAPAPPRPAAPQAPRQVSNEGARAPQEVAQGNPGAAPTPRPRATPPPRRTAPPSRDNTRPAQTRSLRRAVFAGTTEGISATAAPQPELYPFTPERRTVPSKGMLRIELRMKNNSGIYWETASIALSTPLRNDAMVYRIDSWRDQEEIMIDYAFPEAELESRLTQLRVVQVTGSQARAALADMFNEQRQEFAMAAGRADQTEINRTGEQIAAPGLLGLLASARAPFAQQPARTVSLAEVARGRRLQLTFPAEHEIVRPNEDTLPRGTEVRENASRLFMTACDQALGIQERIRGFIRLLAEQPYEEAMAGEGAAAVTDIRRSLAEFTNSAVSLSMMAESSGDAQVQRLQARLLEFSDRITRQVTAIEVQVRRHDQRFAIQR